MWEKLALEGHLSKGSNNTQAVKQGLGKPSLSALCSPSVWKFLQKNVQWKRHGAGNYTLKVHFQRGMLAGLVCANMGLKSNNFHIIHVFSIIFPYEKNPSIIAVLLHSRVGHINLNFPWKLLKKYFNPHFCTQFWILSSACSLLK